MAWHLRIWRPPCPHHPFRGGFPWADFSHTNAWFPIPWAEGEALLPLGNMLWPWTTACEIPELNLNRGVFWPALIYAYQIFGPSFCIFPSCSVLLISVGFLNVLISRKRGSRTGLQWSRTAAFEKLNTLLPFICTSLNNSSCFSSQV